MPRSYSQLRNHVEDFTPHLLNTSTGHEHLTWYGTVMCRIHRLAMITSVDRYNKVTGRYCITCDRNLLEIGIRLGWLENLFV